jgi:hypothetical protein
MTYKLPSVHELPHEDAIQREQRRIEREAQRELVRQSLVLDTQAMREVYPNREAYRNR